MIACGYDAENLAVPLAFALVNEENASNWNLFMRWFRQEVIDPGRLVCVISDRDSRIKNVSKNRLDGWWEEGGEAVHRYCA